MDFPQIRMQSTFGQIDINTQNARLTIEQPPAGLRIEQPKAEMSVDRTPARLTIDQSRAWAEVGLKSTRERIAETAQQGHQAVMEGITRRTQEGEELMKIENGGNAVTAQAKRIKRVPQHEYNIGWIPSWGSVQIDYDPGRLDINWRVNKPIIESQNHQPIINYYPGKVDIQMKQYPSLNIDVEI